MLHWSLLGDFIALSAVAQEPGRVLVVGDSISAGYTEPLTKLLAGKYAVYNINVGATRDCVAKIDQWLGNRHWDVIVFNFGLEDMKLDENGMHQVEIPQYEANLKMIAGKLSNTGASLLWVETTPVPTGNLDPPRRREDVAAYNRAANRALELTPHFTCYLYSFAESASTAIFQQNGDVHFTPAGYNRLAELISRCIVYRNGECIMTQ